jgi:hypothetical protein
MTRNAHNDTLFGIYLNDHLAGAMVGVELARRLASAERNQVPGPALSRMATEIQEDRSALIEMMRALGVPVRPYKSWLAWAGEKAGRLKPNNRLVSRSPLSRVLELEMLRLGVEGKAAAWRTLRARARDDSRLDTQRLDHLIERAHTQIADLERLRVLAATEAFGGLADVSAQPADETSGGVGR